LPFLANHARFCLLVERGGFSQSGQPRAGLVLLTALGRLAGRLRASPSDRGKFRGYVRVVKGNQSGLLAQGRTLLPEGVPPGVVRIADHGGRGERRAGRARGGPGRRWGSPTPGNWRGWPGNGAFKMARSEPKRSGSSAA
jgi:hypothetical protein